jgi:O-antigen/teichoic acid export membrane protein
MLLYFLPPSTVGIYSVGVTIAQTLWYITNALNTVLFPRIASSDDAGEALAFMKKALRCTVFVVFVVVVILVLLGFPLVNLLYGVKFSQSYWVFIALLPALLADVIYRTLFSWFKGIGKPMVVSILTWGSVVINVSLNFLLIPRFGIYGAAVSSGVSYNLRTFFLIYIFLSKTNSTMKETFVIKAMEIKSIVELFQTKFRRLIPHMIRD